MSTSQPCGPSALLVLRVWRDDEHGLCARLLETSDPRTPVSTWATCTATAATLHAVASWLERWADPQDPSPQA